MSAHKIISDLVEKFSLHLDAYKSGSYNETQVRREFIDPFFKALGWDIDNEKGYSEVYKEVIHEDAIKIGGLTKAPDYCFRLGGNRKFFVEAKKPSVDVKDDIHPAFQLRRYCWSAKLPLSILTDFEEFAVYDGRVRPDPKDKSSVARTLFLTYRDYADRWEELISLFSPEAILKGSFDRYVESAKIKKGTATVDEVFLKEIESWRNELARNIALRNDSLTQRELNFAVQQTIDRIIFLRICEDRGIEPYGQLMALQNGTNVYERLVGHFRRADDRYNSGLFHFKKEKERDESPDTLTLSLTIDDKILKDIFKNLYYPESPYEFSVLSADILGQVYEQFLGKVIRLTDGHRAVVEDKPETKKAGGVYYTPTYIVDYIVKHTLGKMLESKRPKQIVGLSVLDPACGSGSFLIVAYQCLLDWYRDCYIEDGPEKHAKKSKPLLFRGPGGDWRLTTAERKRILLEHIYGVDIDAQAVEVTKLSLLLKVLEGESGDSLTNQLRLFQERALPDLGSNIKCGNSLIGPDFYEGQQMNMTGIGEEDRLRINVFDWEGEFSKAMKAGGFNAVIGNPPWGASFSDHELNYLRNHYSQVIARMVDSYIYFIDRAIQLAKDNGLVGFIIPSTILNQIDTKPIRQLLLTRGISELISMGQGIFGPKVLNTSTILISSRLDRQARFVLSNLSTLPHTERRAALLKLNSTTAWLDWKELASHAPDLTFSVGDIGASALLGSLRRKHGVLSDLLKNGIQRGISPDVAAAHVISKADAKDAKLEEELLRLSISGQQVKRYREWKPDQFIIYTTRDALLDQYPRTARHLEKFRHLNSCKEVETGKHPYWALHRPRSPEIFKSPKFIGLTTSKTLELIYDEGRSVFVTDAMYVFTTKPDVDPWAFMAIFRSKLLLFLYRVANQGDSRVIPQVKAAKLEPLPFPKWAPRSDIILKLSERCKEMYLLNTRLEDSKTPQERKTVERQIVATNRQIDGLVYELYGLAEEEIGIVEGVKQETPCNKQK